MATDKNTNPTYITERHRILDDEALVLRTKQSKDVWQFRMRILPMKNSSGKNFRVARRMKLMDELNKF